MTTYQLLLPFALVVYLNSPTRWRYDHFHGYQFHSDRKAPGMCAVAGPRLIQTGETKRLPDNWTRDIVLVERVVNSAAANRTSLFFLVYWCSANHLKPLRSSAGWLFAHLLQKGAHLYRLRKKRTSAVYLYIGFIIWKPPWAPSAVNNYEVCSKLSEHHPRSLPIFVLVNSTDSYTAVLLLPSDWPAVCCWHHPSQHIRPSVERCSDHSQQRGMEQQEWFTSLLTISFDKLQKPFQNVFRAVHHWNTVAIVLIEADFIGISHQSSSVASVRKLQGTLLLLSDMKFLLPSDTMDFNQQCSKNQKHTQDTCKCHARQIEHFKAR